MKQAVTLLLILTASPALADSLGDYLARCQTTLATVQTQSGGKFSFRTDSLCACKADRLRQAGYDPARFVEEMDRLGAETAYNEEDTRNPDLMNQKQAVSQKLGQYSAADSLALSKCMADNLVVNRTGPESRQR